MTVTVKICGVMQPDHARAAVEAGADYIGLIFAPSRRRIGIDTAREIVAATRNAAAEQQRAVQIVGVFVNEQPETINAIARELGLDIAQLSGYEDRAIADQITLPVVKTVRLNDDPIETAWLASLDQIDVPYQLHVDAHVAGSFGGAGVTGDWQRAADLAQRRPIWLAGGLTPENVAAAIDQVGPCVVDVSSGVETDGMKDPAKIKAFIRAAQRATVGDHAPKPDSTIGLRP